MKNVGHFETLWDISGRMRHAGQRLGLRRNWSGKRVGDGALIAQKPPMRRRNRGREVCRKGGHKPSSSKRLVAAFPVCIRMPIFLSQMNCRLVTMQPQKFCCCEVPMRLIQLILPLANR